SITRWPPRAKRFPYTTLFRSCGQVTEHVFEGVGRARRHAHGVSGLARALRPPLAPSPSAPPRHPLPTRPARTPGVLQTGRDRARSEEHTSELQSREKLVCRSL